MIATKFGTSPWNTQQIADLTGVCVTRSTKKLQQFEQRLHGLLAAMVEREPARRTDRLAEMIVAVLETGGQLAADNRDRLRRRIRELIDVPEIAG